MSGTMLFGNRRVLSREMFTDPWVVDDLLDSMEIAIVTRAWREGCYVQEGPHWSMWMEQFGSEWVPMAEVRMVGIPRKSNGHRPIETGDSS